MEASPAAALAAQGLEKAVPAPARAYDSAKIQVAAGCPSILGAYELLARDPVAPRRYRRSEVCQDLRHLYPPLQPPAQRQPHYRLPAPLEERNGIRGSRASRCDWRDGRIGDHASESGVYAWVEKQHLLHVAALLKLSPR